MPAAALSRVSGGARPFVIFWAEQSSAVVDGIMIRNRLKYTAKHVKKGQRQVNKKFCELKGRNIGIAEKAKETRSGML